MGVGQNPSHTEVQGQSSEIQSQNKTTNNDNKYNNDDNRCMGMQVSGRTPLSLKNKSFQWQKFRKHEIHEQPGYT